MIPWWLVPLLLDLLVVYVAAVCGRSRDLPYAEMCAAGVLIIGLAATLPIWGVCALLGIFL